ncbi:GntR family transcriptional regulator [uncultured Sutterella sp.]|uniref:GntR family transcriptional regulator n=1 Tax=uncultured Sutterella sp. TaxID=286133 RepID=UPI00262D8B8A|nr:GntR family transcriptional regulator [uncultured Sutterella sp.]
MTPSPFFPALQRKALYEAVKDEILMRIRQDVWKAGSMLPNEIELARLFNVSQGTVRRALHELVEAGLLVRRQGKGTFVNEYGTNRDYTQRQFVRVRPDREGVWRSRARLIKFERVPASVKTAGLLDIPPASPVIHVRRELQAILSGEEGVTEAFDEIFLPEEVFPTLTEEVLSADVRSLYSLYQSECGVTVSKVEDSAKATLINPEQAAAAGVAMPYPAILLRRISYAVTGRPVELRYLTTITDRCHFVFN